MNKELCHFEALKYSSKTKFKQQARIYYNFCKRNGFLNEVCSHMKKYNYTKKGFWTIDKCQEKALLCEKRVDFQKLYAGAYFSAYRNEWLEKLCSHMDINYIEKDRLVYVFEFADNYAYIGLTHNSKERHARHLNDKDCVVYLHNLKNIEYNYKHLTDYIPEKEASKLETHFENIYKENGWVLLNIAPTGSLGSKYLYWNKERCKEEAMKYNSISELENKSGGAYKSIIRNNWREELCSHMIRLTKPAGYWSFENCKHESQKYNNRSNFSKGSGRAYNVSLSNKWLDDFFPYEINKLEKYF